MVDKTKMDSKRPKSLQRFKWTKTVDSACANTFGTNQDHVSHAPSVYRHCNWCACSPWSERADAGKAENPR